MATGGSSIYKGSDLIYDYSCSKCEEDGFNTEAKHFCPQCEHYLCDNCVNMHNGYHKKHTVYGRKDIKKWTEFSMDRCDQHGNKLEVHCNDHMELCCSVCVALDHRQCSSISHLPELAKGFLKTADFILLPAAVDEMRSRLDELKNARLNYQDKLKHSYKDIMAEIKALRKETNKILDQLEKNTFDQLDRLKNDLETMVNDDVATCADMNARLKTMINNVQQMTGKHRETNSYIEFRKCQIKLNEAKRVVQKVKSRPNTGIGFESDENILPFLTKLNGLGNVRLTPSMDTFQQLFKQMRELNRTKAQQQAARSNSS